MWLETQGTNLVNWWKRLWYVATRIQLTMVTHSQCSRASSSRHSRSWSKETVFLWKILIDLHNNLRDFVFARCCRMQHRNEERTLFYFGSTTCWLYRCNIVDSFFRLLFAASFIVRYQSEKIKWICVQINFHGNKLYVCLFLFSFSISFSFSSFSFSAIHSTIPLLRFWFADGEIIWSHSLTSDLSPSIDRLKCSFSLRCAESFSLEPVATVGTHWRRRKYVLITSQNVIFLSLEKIRRGGQLKVALRYGVRRSCNGNVA